MKKPKIIYRDSGIGYTVNYKGKQWIELNKNLKKYPKFYKGVLQHELKHYNSTNTLDFWMEIKDSLRNTWNITKFVFRYPKALICLSPIGFDCKGHLLPDYFQCLIYSLLVLFILIIIMI